MNYNESRIVQRLMAGERQADVAWEYGLTKGQLSGIAFRARKSGLAIPKRENGQPVARVPAVRKSARSKPKTSRNVVSIEDKRSSITGSMIAGPRIEIEATEPTEISGNPVVISAKPVSIIERTESQCAFVLDDGRMCGNHVTTRTDRYGRKEPSSYCAGHHAKCHQPRKPKQRAEYAEAAE